MITKEAKAVIEAMVLHLKLMQPKPFDHYKNFCDRIRYPKSTAIVCVSGFSFEVFKQDKEWYLFSSCSISDLVVSIREINLQIEMHGGVDYTKYADSVFI